LILEKETKAELERKLKETKAAEELAKKTDAARI